MIQSQPPPELIKAIEEFNRHQFFECHETLEEIWRAEPGPIRRFYQGILQVGVGFHHLLHRKNHHGATHSLEIGIEKLRDFPPNCLGVDVSRLIAEAEACRQALLPLGPERLHEFDTGHIPIIRYVSHPEDE